MKKNTRFVSILLFLFSTTFSYSQTNYAPGVVVSDFFGGTAACFSGPSSIAVDLAGNVYVAVGTFGKIKKITPAGFVSTIVEGVGPTNIAVDASGNVYFVLNNQIKKLAPTGTISVLAGSGTYGNTNGQGLAASFGDPTDIAVDASGNVYVADMHNNQIRKITPSGLVSTLAGSMSSGNADGQGAAASFFYPISVTTDANGNVYVADNNNNAIRKITPSGVVSTLVGATIFGPLNEENTFSILSSSGGSITTDKDGNLYISDDYHELIRKITPSGVQSIFAGSGFIGKSDGQGTAASFASPASLATDALGNLYVADFSNNIIRAITPSGFVSTLAGTTYNCDTDGKTLMTSCDNPAGVEVDAFGNTYVADTYNNVIRKVSSDGTVSILAGSGIYGYLDGQGATAKFSGPSDVAVDATGNVYVADTYTNTIRKITPTGFVSTFAGSDGTFNRPLGIAVDASGNVYVSDTENNLIRKITSTGGVSVFAGSGIPGSANGTGANASFRKPSGIAVDAAGNVYVADSENYLIRKITPSGVVSKLAGSVYGGADGQGGSFRGPKGIAVDALGNVYVADAAGHAIRKITPSGLVSTLAGKGVNNYGYKNGSGETALFNFPSGVAVDASGAVYVADPENDIIRKLTIEDPITTSIVSNLSGSSISLFPNPANDAITISFPILVEGTLSLVDMHGSTIVDQLIHGEQALVSTTSLPSGIYVLRIITSNTTYMSQVVVAR